MVSGKEDGDEDGEEVDEKTPTIGRTSKQLAATQRSSLRASDGHEEVAEEVKERFLSLDVASDGGQENGRRLEQEMSDDRDARLATEMLSHHSHGRNEEGDMELSELEMQVQATSSDIPAFEATVNLPPSSTDDINHFYLVRLYYTLKGNVTTYWRDHKFRILKTICYCFVFMAVGVYIGILGPTLLALRDKVRTTSGGVGWVATSRGIGYLFGSMLGGKSMDYFPGHWVIISGGFFLTAAIALTPFLSSLAFLIVITVFGGICGGLLDVCCNAMVVWVWKERSGAWLQVLHFSFGVGGFLSPILVTHIDNAFEEVEWTYWLVAIIVSPAPLGLFFLKSPRADGNVSDGHHSYRSSTEQPAVVEMSNIDPVSQKDKPSNNILRQREESKLRNPSLKETILITTVIGGFLFMCTGVEINYTVYIFSFLVEEKIIDDDDDVGNYLTSAFWAALTLGRLLIVPLAAYVKPKTILLIDVIGCIASSSIQVSLPKSLTAAWITGIGTGLFLASTSPAALSYPTSVGISLSGNVISWILVIGNCGEMTVPLFTSAMISLVGYHSFVWINAISFVFAALFFGLLFLLFRISDGSQTIERTENRLWRVCHKVISFLRFMRSHHEELSEKAQHSPKSIFVNLEEEEEVGTEDVEQEQEGKVQGIGEREGH